MENLQEYNEFVNENEELFEGKGIHPAIRNKLLAFIHDNPTASYEDAKKHISSVMKNWNLTKEDFEEAVKAGKKESKKK